MFISQLADQSCSGIPDGVHIFPSLTHPQEGGGAGDGETFLIPFLGWLICVLPDMDVGGVDW